MSCVDLQRRVERLEQSAAAADARLHRVAAQVWEQQRQQMPEEPCLDTKAEHAEVESPKLLLPGTYVVLQGLVGRSDLNGEYATVLRYVPAKERYAVRLCTNGAQVLLRHDNLCAEAGEAVRALEQPRALRTGLFEARKKTGCGRAAFLQDGALGARCRGGDVRGTQTSDKESADEVVKEQQGWPLFDPFYRRRGARGMQFPVALSAQSWQRSRRLGAAKLPSPSRTHAQALLPAEFQNRVVIREVRRGGGAGSAGPAVSYVYLLSVAARTTARAVREARALVAAVDPHVVFVELCPKRKAVLAELAKGGAEAKAVEATCGTTELMPPPAPLSEVARRVLRGETLPFEALYDWAMSTAAAGEDARPNDECVAALAAGVRCSAVWYLGDRPLTATVHRAWATLSVWQRLKLGFLLGWRLATGALRNGGHTACLQELRASWLGEGQLPGDNGMRTALARVLLREHEEWSVRALRLAATLYPVAGQRVVALVGEGRVSGVSALWDEAQLEDEAVRDANLEALAALPPCVSPFRVRRGIVSVAALVVGCVAVLRLRMK